MTPSVCPSVCCFRFFPLAFVLELEMSICLFVSYPMNCFCPVKSVSGSRFIPLRSASLPTDIPRISPSLNSISVCSSPGASAVQECRVYCICTHLPFPHPTPPPQHLQPLNPPTESIFHLPPLTNPDDYNVTLTKRFLLLPILLLLFKAQPASEAGRPAWRRPYSIPLDAAHFIWR